MKQITYFFIGVLISWVFLTVSYSTEIFPQGGTGCDVPGDPTPPVTPLDLIITYFDDQYEAQVTPAADPQTWTYCGTENSVPSGIWTRYCFYKWTGGTPIDDNKIYQYKTYVYPDYATNTDCWDITAPSLDSDSDQIPDLYDFYPNDPTPYSVKLIGFQTDDGTPDGTHVRENYITDRGDIFSIGDDYDITKQDNLIYNGTWQDPGDIFGTISSGGGFGSSSTSETSPAQSIYSNSPATGSPPGGDPAISTGSASTGTETDTEGIRKIIDNTNVTAGNIGSLAGYLKDINRNLGDISNLTAQNTAQNNDVLSPAQQDDITSQAASNQSSYDTAVSTITGDASLTNDAPDGYKTKTDITSKMDDFIANNPMAAIINNTGIEISGAQPYLSWTYKGQDILFRVDKYDDALEAFGVILLSMTTLSGLLMLFKK